MKKMLVALAAVMMMAFSVVPAFAAEDTTAPTDPTASTSATDSTESTDSTDPSGTGAACKTPVVKSVNKCGSVSVNSPVATRTVERQCVTPVACPDKGGTSPKTGSDDSLAYALLAASVIGCGAASAILVKMAKKH